ncbi:class I SAM-dependent methyltransferase [Streptantibioticus ferralitis]|uniref:Class I SAM-dependent methyltransferase n=1 Tax=Streptantibioticus ferralitis TaxID=236510 RepID=A0ABT5Z7P7_9ACTN|nr:class I SAM-dependent methyltransferase [Streptantibioticus ferralitis]MDF2259834.1 class I SAM-dependent methyltransferase [Streptantibioticus ferralitis]
MTDFTAATRATYDTIAAEYARQWSTPPAWVAAELDRLAALLPAGSRIADIGCGPGHHTRALRERGFRVTGFDLSRRMLGAARVPGLVQADMRALPLAARSLGAVWCVAALLHVPRPEVPQVLGEFGRVLRPGGELLLSVAEGDGEGWDERAYGASLRRWFVLHRFEALAALLAEAGFGIVGHEREATHRDWLRIHARRR